MQLDGRDRIKDIQFNTANALDADTGLFVWDKTNHRLGVNVSAPTSALQISGTFTVSSTVTGANPALYVGTSGNVGIGTSNPNANLDAIGTVSATNVAADPVGGVMSTYWLKFKNTNTYASSLCYLNSGGFNYIGACTSLSKWKKNQSPLSVGLDAIMKLRPVEFDWTPDHGGFHDLGFIAEDVERDVPLAAEYSDGKLIGVKYRQMTALLTKGIQELKTDNDNLVSKTTILEFQIKAASDNIDELRHELHDLKSGVGFKRAVGQ